MAGTTVLARSEERYRLLAEVSPQIVWMAERDGTPYYANARWRAFTGTDFDELQRRGWLDFVEPAERADATRRWLAHLAAALPFEMEVRLRHHDGEWRRVLVRGNPVRDADDRLERWVGVVIDVDDLRRAERAALERGEFLQVVLDASRLGTWDFYPDSDRLYWDARCRALFGVPADVAISQEGTFVAGLHPEDREATLAAVAKALEPGGPGTYDVEYRIVGRSDGTVRWVRATGRAFRGPGRETRIVGTVEDVGERKQREAERQQLLEAERAAREAAERAGALKDQFLATLSHELRTPLNAILGWTTVLRRKSADPATLAQAIDVIERNARAQASLIADLLDMSSIASGKLRLDVRRVDVASLVEAAVESVRPAAEARGVRLAIDVRQDEPPLLADPARLQQVFWNLLSNAVKFTPRDGRVAVSARHGETWLEVVVSDTGIGIAREFLPHVFERFRQADGSSSRQHGGLGLGLALVRQLVEMHGGHVRAESAGAGRGATFTVELPLGASSVGGTPGDAEAPPEAGGSTSG